MPASDCCQYDVSLADLVLSRKEWTGSGLIREFKDVWLDSGKVGGSSCAKHIHIDFALRTRCRLGALGCGWRLCSGISATKVLKGRWHLYFKLENDDC